MSNSTFPEVCEKLKELDEVTLLETLDLKSDDIVDRCLDLIEDNFESLSAQFDEGKQIEIEFE